MYSREIEISIEDGPVIVPTLSARGADNQFDLSGGITCHEKFPPSEEPAYYQLSLKKLPQRIEEVAAVENELKNLLIQLSHFWFFSGGTFLRLDTHQRLSKLRYASNAQAVETEFLSSLGLKRVTSSLTISANVIGCYRCMPLKIAIQLCQAAEKDIPMNKMFKYYHEGIIDLQSWFIHIYKIRDVLCKVFGSEVAVRSTLQISYSDWKEFGRILNSFDLRHPDITSKPVSLPHEKVNHVRELARQWLIQYLKHKGLATM